MGKKFGLQLEKRPTPRRPQQANGQPTNFDPNSFSFDKLNSSRRKEKSTTFSSNNLVRWKTNNKQKDRRNRKNPNFFHPKSDGYPQKSCRFSSHQCVISTLTQTLTKDFQNVNEYSFRISAVKFLFRRWRLHWRLENTSGEKRLATDSTQE
jgi:hypothetical protein